MFEPPCYESIFEYLDDYTLYCHYIGEELEIGKRYSSPLREGDDDPSFSLFFSSFDKGRIYFKDHSTGKSGNVFNFISLLFNITYTESLYKIDMDFLLGIWDNNVKINKPNIVLKPPKIKKSMELGITSKNSFTGDDVIFWSNYNIFLKTLIRYNVTSVAAIHLKANGTTEIVYPKGLAFAYRIGQYYKIYQPYDEKYKFTNNYPSYYIEGFEQLEYKSDTLIITKSLKDVMVLHTMGYEAVACKSENTVMSKDYFQHFNNKYKNIYVLFDNDGKHSAHKYPYPLLQVETDDYNSKDISDIIFNHGIEIAKIHLNYLINGSAER